MKVDKTTPLWDNNLSLQERIDWLLSAMTVDEKLTWLSSQPQDLERLGIPAFFVGGEAAHGVEGRNDQNGLKIPDVSTSFPQPIGMSASWDRELIEKAGEVTGIEARVIYHRHPERGLSRWAPTVDLERDPRWGRNEEGYGEDPVLTGAMAGAYVRGMQGTDDYYIRCAATLKHFYGNNTEVGRGWKNSSMDTRNKKELYQEPFRRCIEDGKVQGIMTAYNKVSGTVGLLNPEVQELLKDQYGLVHAVSDGGAMSLAVSNQHEFTLYGQAIAGAIKAGVDAMSESPADVEKAAREAYGLGLLTEKDMDRAIRNMMTTKLRLGVYDRENRNPFDRVTEADLTSDYGKEISLKLAEESLVLLKNDEDFLPLSGLKAEEMALIGPMADQWFTDWYCGTPAYTKTLRDGLRELGYGDIPYDDGCDRITLHYQGKNVAADEKGRLVLTDGPAEVFIREDWGEGTATLRSVRTGLLINEVLGAPEGVDDKNIGGSLWVSKEKAFDWFVLEIVRFVNKGESVVLQDRFHYPFCVEKDGSINIRKDSEGTAFTVKIVEKGSERAAKLARGKKAVILAVGCHSLINAKEEVDRNTLDMPEIQAELLAAVAAEAKTAVALFTNYPYSCGKEAAKVPAILMSATGSQDMGSAMARGLFGLCAPAGRLNMTWYEKTEDLPDIDDYDIIYGGRTYRYFEGQPLYPFGYGLSYGCFEYSNFKAAVEGSLLQFEVTVKNTGKSSSDEVIAVYATAPASRAKKPLRQLLCFTREHGIEPGESRIVKLSAPVSELRFFDVVSGKLMVEEGSYSFFVDYDAKAKASVFVPGEKTGSRKCCSSVERVAAEYYDSYSNLQIGKGNLGYTALYVNNPDKPAEAEYRDCLLKADTNTLFMHMKSVYGVKVEVLLDGKPVGSFEGNTRESSRYECHIMDRYWPKEREIRDRLREPIFEDIPIKLDVDLKEESVHTIGIKLSGDVKFACFYLGKL